MSPPRPDAFPAVTAEQMLEVDRRAVERYELALVQMMENAGRALARVARERFLVGANDPGRVVVLAGPGGNGGGAMVAARRLAGWGVRVRVLATATVEAMAPVTARQARTLAAFGVDVDTVGEADGGSWPDSAGVDLVLDGLLGYSGRGEPRGAVRDAIRWVSAAGVPILALDVPSGVDATSGAVAGVAIHASATVTLAAPKTGLRSPSAAPHVGALYLADLGIPAAAYEGLIDPAVVATWFVADDVVLVADEVVPVR
ncbi:MAG: NAD(P)H-hydrate epimerase [Trueperaceae bacterium]|nr:NAD(P)H-hydrate epimerase [Trueperaceae bacterium]